MFKPTQNTTLPRFKQQLTPDAHYWKTSLDNFRVVKEYGAISGLDIHRITNEVLVTSPSRVALYDITTLEAKKSFNGLTHHTMYKANLRPRDGSLFVTGTEDGRVLIYDMNGAKPLRCLDDRKTKHLAAVQNSSFLGPHKVVSFSDDKSIKLWDISDSSLIQEFGAPEATGARLIQAHNDYIRAGAIVNDKLIVSGSYDHTVKVWDPSIPSSAAHTFKVGYPVESVIVKDSLIIACGGKRFVVYDILAGKVFTKISNVHSKTITCMTWYDKFLITGSLDGQAKVFDATYKPVSSISYSGTQILSMAVNKKLLAVGTTDGSVMIRRFKLSTDPVVEPSQPLRRKGTKRYFGTEIFERVDSKDSVDGQKKTDSDLAVIESKRFKSAKDLPAHDKFLKKFDYARALEYAMRKSPAIVVSVMEELIRRSALRIAIAGKNDHDLKALVNFIAKNIRDPKFVHVLTDVAAILTEIYLPFINRSPQMEKMFSKLYNVVDHELLVMQQMKALAGQITMVVENT
ncbi:U3 small nucleolar RNA-associated protein 15 -like protein [Halotydeus destructor]|nr:U3 small nucleolar RNA-associated protein 15 -like protein [Halotydeus destructor]